MRPLPLLALGSAALRSERLRKLCDSVNIESFVIILGRFPTKTEAILCTLQEVAS